MYILSVGQFHQKKIQKKILKKKKNPRSPKKKNEKRVFMIIWDVWGTSLALFVDFLNLVEWLFWDLTNGGKYCVYPLCGSIPQNSKNALQSIQKSIRGQNHCRYWILHRKLGLVFFYRSEGLHFVVFFFSRCQKKNPSSPKKTKISTKNVFFFFKKIWIFFFFKSWKF